MIRLDAELYGETSFKEWASLFSGKYFVMIVIYADESGTHDPNGKLTGSAYPIIAGFAARKSVWDKFCVGWKAVLDKYDAPYYHGRELTTARVAVLENRKENKELSKNPYYIRKWDFKKIESFRKSLAKVASADGKIPIVGGMHLTNFNKIKDEFSDKDPYKWVMSHFFSVYHKETGLQWGNFKSDVTFVFDQNEKRKWVNSVHEVFDAYQKKDPRMSGPNFGDKKKFPFWPLQAADFLAYRMRQLAEDNDSGQLQIDEVDRILLKNLYKSATIINPQLKPFLK